MFGASKDLVFTPGEWQLNFNYRGAKGTDHYSGTQFQYARQANNNYVRNTQQLYDFGGSYTFTERFTLSGGIPVVNATWSIPEPSSPPIGPRREQNSSGLGDITGVGRFWMLSPAKHPRGNFSLGLGFKAPTGKYDVEDAYPDLGNPPTPDPDGDGADYTNKAVDQSIQPGDGGWGIIFDMQGYKQTKHVTFYGSGTYLVNPRDTNGTPSIIVGLGFAGNPAFADLLENSVPDQYMARAGAAFPVGKSPLTLNLGFRIEGLPRYDLIGDSHGWRRPGYETFLEPGFLFTFGRSTWSIYVPIGLLENRRPNPYTGNPGDATFPDYMILAGYSYSFPARGAGLEKPTARPPAPPGGGAPPTVPGGPPGAGAAAEGTTAGSATLDGAAATDGATAGDDLLFAEPPCPTAPGQTTPRS